jgi:hypothetical protein
MECHSCGWRFGPYPYVEKHVREDGTCENCDGPADLRPIVAQMRKDLEDAAGELALPVPEPGTDMAKLMAANVLLRRENEKLRHEAVDVEDAVEQARGRTAAEVIESLMPVGPLTNAMPSYLSLVEGYITERFGVTQDDTEDTFEIEGDRRKYRQQLEDRLRVAEHKRDEARANLAEASKLWDGAETSDWFKGVRKEAAYQVTKWGVGHDAGKGPEHWFWLVGYLAGKALRSAMEGDLEKAKHHTISTGAALLGWHARLSGVATQFRPGIRPPEGESKEI